MAEQGPEGEERRRRALPVVALVVAGTVVLVVGLTRRRRRVPADLGRQLVELFGEVGDVLSEYQDVVAGEAYLGSRGGRWDVQLVFGDPPASGLKRIATYARCP